MKLQRMIAITLSVALTGMLLTACGASSESTASSAQPEPAAPAKTATEVFDTINAVNTISNPRELIDMDIELEFMLPAESVVEYVGVASNDNGNAGMTVVITCAEGKGEEVLGLMESYASNKVIFWGNYEEFADAVTACENARTQLVGDYVIQVFASSESEGYDAIDSAIASAIG